MACRRTPFAGGCSAPVQYSGVQCAARVQEHDFRVVGAAAPGPGANIRSPHMYRIEFEPGDVGVFRSVEEVATAIKSGVITARARIYHQASDKWLPIEFHPHYRKALDMVAKGPIPAPPSLAPTLAPVLAAIQAAQPEPAEPELSDPEPIEP